MCYGICESREFQILVYRSFSNAASSENTALLYSFTDLLLAGSLPNQIIKKPTIDLSSFQFTVSPISASVLEDLTFK